MYAIANGVGRLFFGYVHDRFGRAWGMGLDAVFMGCGLVLLAALPFVTWVYAIAMLILAAYKVQCTVDILRLSGIRWYFPAISAALAVVLALFILLNPNTAMNIVWGFMGVSIILEAGLEIATIILLK